MYFPILKGNTRVCVCVCTDICTGGVHFICVYWTPVYFINIRFISFAFQSKVIFDPTLTLHIGRLLLLQRTNRFESYNQTNSLLQSTTNVRTSFDAFIYLIIQISLLDKATMHFLQLHFAIPTIVIIAIRNNLNRVYLCVISSQKERIVLHLERWLKPYMLQFICNLIFRNNREKEKNKRTSWTEP